MAVPSACVMGVAGVAAASVGGLTGTEKPAEDTPAEVPASETPEGAAAEAEAAEKVTAEDAGKSEA